MFNKSDEDPDVVSFKICKLSSDLDIIARKLSFRFKSLCFKAKASSGDSPWYPLRLLCSALSSSFPSFLFNRAVVVFNLVNPA